MTGYAGRARSRVQRQTPWYEVRLNCLLLNNRRWVSPAVSHTNVLNMRKCHSPATLTDFGGRIYPILLTRPRCSWNYSGSKCASSRSADLKSSGSVCPVEMYRLYVLVSRQWSATGRRGLDQWQCYNHWYTSSRMSSWSLVVEHRWPASGQPSVTTVIQSSRCISISVIIIVILIISSSSSSSSSDQNSVPRQVSKLVSKKIYALCLKTKCHYVP